MVRMHRYARHILLGLLGLYSTIAVGAGPHDLEIIQGFTAAPNLQGIRHPFATADQKEKNAIVATAAEIEEWEKTWKTATPPVPFSIYISALRIAQARNESKDEKRKLVGDALKNFPQTLNQALTEFKTEKKDAEQEKKADELLKKMIGLDGLRAFANPDKSLNENRLLLDLGLNAKNSEGKEDKAAKRASAKLEPILREQKEKPTETGSTVAREFVPLEIKAAEVAETDPAKSKSDLSGAPGAEPSEGSLAEDRSDKSGAPESSDAATTDRPPGLGPVDPQGPAGTPQDSFAQDQTPNDDLGAGANDGTGTGRDFSEGAADNAASPPGPGDGGSSGGGGSGEQPPSAPGGGAGGYQSTNKGTQQPENPKGPQFGNQELPQAPPPPQLSEGLNPRQPQDERRDVSDMETMITNRTQTIIQAMAAATQAAILAAKSAAKNLNTQPLVAPETYGSRSSNFASGPRTNTGTPRVRSRLTGGRTNGPTSLRRTYQTARKNSKSLPVKRRITTTR